VYSAILSRRKVVGEKVDKTRTRHKMTIICMQQIGRLFLKRYGGGGIDFLDFKSSSYVLRQEVKYQRVISFTVTSA